MAEPQHVPVLLEESLEYLNVRPGGVVVDATLGFAGHSSAIARKLGAKGRLICFDRDEQAMAKAKARLEALAEELGAESEGGMPTVEYVARPFSEIAEVIRPGELDGLLADFGVSSMQLGEAHRGFSFRAEGPLDMRMDPRSELTAEQVVNQADEEDLANLIYEFGEERRSRRIARAVVGARPL
jgi:16S rRNA (cytosine1402-N4)-methyltransferase